MDIIENIAYLSEPEEVVSGHSFIAANVRRMTELYNIIETRHTALRGLTTDFDIATSDQLQAIGQQEARLASERAIAECMLCEVFEFEQKK